MTVNIPPMAIGPNWPKPVIIGSVLSGIGHFHGAHLGHAGLAHGV